MNYAIILAGGTGQRMKRSGMPKQFLEVYGKPIIVYTLEEFDKNEMIDRIVIPCNENWIDHMKLLINKYQIKKVCYIIPGGKDRSSSVSAGVNLIADMAGDLDLAVIHDGVRPLIQQETINKNIETASIYGNAVTVHANIETVVITETDSAQWDNFQNRNITYTLTAPQTFRIKEMKSMLEKAKNLRDDENSMPLLDTALIYAKFGKKLHLVFEKGNNLKITTPEDYYYLRAYLELQESKHILGV